MRPYAGAGVNFTAAWEKSGVLDSTDMAGSVGPALQAGMDVDLASYVLLNIDLAWNTLTAKLTNGGAPLADLKIDPLVLGLGVGFGFWGVHRPSVSIALAGPATHRSEAVDRTIPASR